MRGAHHSGARCGIRATALRPIPIAWFAVLCLCVLAPACVEPAAASVLFRCAGPRHETAYVSSTRGYAHCVKIGAWATPVRPSFSSERRSQHKRTPPHATTSPGRPPHAVGANPAVLKVMPLGSGDSIKVQKLVVRHAWQPLPAELLDALGEHVLPRLLGVAAPPVPATPAAGTTAVPTPAAMTRVPPSLGDHTLKPPWRGAVYRVVQKNGTVLYTNIEALAKGHHARTLFTYIIECYACGLHSKINWNTVPLHLVAYHRDIRAAARLTGVDTALLRAVIHAESGFNPHALSYKGAQGLMQLMPGTAFELGVGDAFDPAENISGGARYLATLLGDYHGNVKLAAAAYNAGANAVAKYGGVPPYAETQVYVKRVALLYRRYRKALGEPAVASLAVAQRGD